MSIITENVRINQVPKKDNPPQGMGPGRWVMADNELSMFWLEAEDEADYLNEISPDPWDTPGHHD